MRLRVPRTKQKYVVNHKVSRSTKIVIFSRKIVVFWDTEVSVPENYLGKRKFRVYKNSRVNAISYM